MTLLLASHDRFVDHLTGRGHPERPERLGAVLEGLAPLRDAIVEFEPTPATPEQLASVHRSAHVSDVSRRVAAGEDRLDADTRISRDSYEVALLAAGAGLDCIARLDAGEADAGFCVVRPPGHHAVPERAMGFCLFNNIAVAAAALADRGEKVLIVDFDAHHGNGTQDIFFDDPRVLFLSLHQYPFYPGTGAHDEVGTGDGWMTTINIPLPVGATGDVYRGALDRLVLGEIEQFAPTWLLYSAGFDAHRRDPLTDLGLTSADYADIVGDLSGVVAPGRVLAFLEGGYDLEALTRSTEAFAGALLGVDVGSENSTSGGPGAEAVDAVAAHRRRIKNDG